MRGKVACFRTSWFLSPIFKITGAFHIWKIIAIVWSVLCPIATALLAVKKKARRHSVLFRALRSRSHFVWHLWRHHVSMEEISPRTCRWKRFHHVSMEEIFYRGTGNNRVPISRNEKVSERIQVNVLGDFSHSRGTWDFYKNGSVYQRKGSRSHFLWCECQVPCRWMKTRSLSFRTHKLGSSRTTDPLSHKK